MKVRVMQLALALMTVLLVAPALADVQGTTPAYYDGQIFTINLALLPPGGQDANLQHNPGINIIYESDGCSPGGQSFVPVIDAIPGDGMNPLWREVQIVFSNSNFPCQQFVRDDDIVAAAQRGDITLQTTDELYRCSVIGKP